MMMLSEGREVSLLFWPKRALLKFLNCPYYICNIPYNIAHKITIDVKNDVLLNTLRESPLYFSRNVPHSHNAPYGVSHEFA